MSETPVEIPKILKQRKVVISNGPDKGKIRDPRVAQEAANSILELIGRATSKGYTVDRKAKEALDAHLNDYVITAQAGKTVSAETAEKKAKNLSITDTLTGLYSRKYFDEQIREKLSEARRLNIPIGLAFGDVRDLKGINDTYGHLQGDKFLQRVAKAIKRATLRHSDIACRLSGDENAVIYPVIQPDKRDKNGYTAKDNLVVASARMVREVRRQNLSMPNGDTINPYMDIGVTLSVAGDTPESILDRADQATYLAKRLFHTDEDKVVVATSTSKGIVFEVAEVRDGNVVYSSIPTTK